MKKIIYTVSFFALVLAFAGIPASAQSFTRLDADIPFDFVIGNKTLAAGKYVMYIRRAQSGAEIVELRDVKNKIVYEGVSLQNGDFGPGKSELVFDKVDGLTALTRVRLENKGVDIRVEKQADSIAAKDKKKSSGIQN